MGAASHLGIRLRDYDARIRTFIPRYEEMLAAAASALTALPTCRATIVDLGTGTGALAARSIAVLPRARVIGIDRDAAMLDLARRRLGGRLTAVIGDFRKTPFPRCHGVTASFALHHIATRRQKAALYARAFAALTGGGALVNADCCLASDARLQRRDRSAWRAHLERHYSATRAEAFLRAWAREDVYVELEDELDLLRRAGFRVDVAWRRDSFAVIVGVKAG